MDLIKTMDKIDYNRKREAIGDQTALCYQLIQEIEKVKATNDSKPIAWACRKCNKVDWNDTEEQLAQPEHVSHRGIDIGKCDGEMIPLFKRLA